MSEKTPIRTLNGHPLVDTTARQSIEELAARVDELPAEGGEDGGYYIPSVTVTGLLGWTGSKTGMPRVEPVNIKGPKGDKGDPGITVTDKSESADDGGSNVVTFSDGTTLTIKNGSKGSAGESGANGVGIASMVQTTTSLGGGGANVWTATLTDGTTSTFTVRNGNDGNPGSPGASITITGVSESLDDGGINEITFSDGTTLTIRNGSKGSPGESGSGSSDNSSPLIVNLTYNTESNLVPDKTFAELYAAFTAGRMLYANLGEESVIYPLIEGWAGDLKFGTLKRTMDGLRELSVTIYSDDTVTTSSVQVPFSTLSFSAGYSGRLIYVDIYGKPHPLRLGPGLKLEDGVLMLDGTVTPDTPSKTAICGTFLCGEVICGEV